MFGVILISLLLVNFAFAGGTANEAKALVDKAATYVKTEGKEKAFAEFSNPSGKFVDRDLYIFIVDFNGLTLAHGGNAKLVGKNMLELKDADG
jgi:signal transduction histidine kinase